MPSVLGKRHNVFPSGIFTDDIYDHDGDGIVEIHNTGSFTAVAAPTITATTAIVTNTISERTAASGVTVDSTLVKDGGVTCTSGGVISVNTISEVTAANGVVVDSTTIKDGGVTCTAGGVVATNTVSEVTAASGVTVDGVLCKDTAITLNNAAGQISAGASTGSHVVLNDDRVEFWRTDSIMHSALGRANGTTFVADGAVSADADDIKLAARGGFFLQADTNDDTIADGLVHPLEVWSFTGAGSATNNMIFRARTTGEINCNSIGEITSNGGITFKQYVNIRAQSADPTGVIAGSFFYDTDTNKLKVYNGTTWETVTSV
jgi:hypothetical protein